MGEPWWVWHWDRLDAEWKDVTYEKVTRWRRGIVTVYRLEKAVGGVEYWVYLPFNVGIGLGLK